MQFYYGKLDFWEANFINLGCIWMVMLLWQPPTKLQEIVTPTKRILTFGYHTTLGDFLNHLWSHISPYTDKAVDFVFLS